MTESNESHGIGCPICDNTVWTSDRITPEMLDGEDQCDECGTRFTYERINTYRTTSIGGDDVEN